MKKIYIIIVIFLVALVACDKEKSGLSDCLDNKIKEFKNSEYACDNGANVKEYQFMGEKVYLFDPGLCGADMFSEVIDGDCNFLGYLGGIAGITKINGTNFSEAVFIRVVWER